MRSLRLLVSPILVVIAGMAGARADWVASGSFQYEDREFDESGFTGIVGLLPVREADIEVVDVNAPKNSSILATGVTDSTGSYSITVPDNKVRDVYVRAVTRSDYSADLHIDVREGGSGQPVFYAVATPVISGHSPAVSVSFGTVTATVGQGGQPFNIYDQMLRGMDYMTFLTGSRPVADDSLITIWATSNGITGSNYSISARTINLRDSAGYDDTVVLHEMGHWAMREYSVSNSPGGFHTFALCNVDLRLAFDEGYATFWGNSVLRHHALAGSNIYVRSNGGPGPGNLVRVADLETDTLYNCRGAAGEVNVFLFLWDIVDGPSTTDTTPGVDDSHDMIDADDGELWEVMTDYIPTASNRTLEDVWDGWFLPPAQNGSIGQMIDIADHLGIEYYADAFEPNPAPAQSAAMAVNAAPLHATFFEDLDGDGAGAVDQDYYSFSASGGEPYVIETLNLLSDGNTSLRLYDTDGQTLLALNDNRASGDDSSKIDWTAPRSDLFYIQVIHSTDWGIYGSYDLVVTTLNPIDNDGDGVHLPSDCDDSNPEIYPGATEICDGIDQNCDGVADEGYDQDLDGYTTCGGDCDDTDPAINPGSAEVPDNGRDDNCNGLIDQEALGGRSDLIYRPLLESDRHRAKDL